MDGRTDAHTNVKEAICPSSFFEDGGQNKTTLFITEKKAKGIFLGMLICADILLDVFDTPDIFWVWLIYRICLLGKH